MQDVIEVEAEQVEQVKAALHQSIERARELVVEAKHVMRDLVDSAAADA
jgi:hypothetical protein